MVVVILPDAVPHSRLHAPKPRLLLRTSLAFMLSESCTIRPIQLHVKINHILVILAMELKTEILHVIIS